MSPQATRAAGVIEPAFGEGSDALHLGQDEKNFRIAELEQRLADARNPPNPALLQGSMTWLNELGILHWALGRLDAAERYFQEFHDLAQSIGSQANLAIAYGGLGNVLHARGDLEGAEAMHRKALALNQRLGQLPWIANDYGNLGADLYARGDLEGAEAMHRKALALNERPGSTAVDRQRLRQPRQRPEEPR